MAAGLGLQLSDLPDELLEAIVAHTCPAAATLALETTCRRLRKISRKSIVWKRHCLDTWKFWADKHELPAKLALPPLQTDWRLLFTARYSADRRADIVFHDMLTSQSGRLKGMQDLAERDEDVRDLLVRSRDNTPDDDHYVLARRWHADAVLQLMNRRNSISVWTRYRAGEDVTLEEALCAIDTFVLGPRYGDFASVKAKFDLMAVRIREQYIDLDSKSVRNKASLIADYLLSKGLVGFRGTTLGTPHVTIRDYYKLRHSFITMALFAPGGGCLPLVSAAIFCAVARRLGVNATPCNFPGHVFAVVELTDEPDASGRPQRLYIDAGQLPHVHESDTLRTQLLRLGYSLEGANDCMKPAAGIDTLDRASRNILHTVNHSRHSAIGLYHADELCQYDHSALYAVSWFVLVRNYATIFRRHAVDDLLPQMQEHFPEDFELIREYCTRDRDPDQQVTEAVRAVKNKEMQRKLRDSHSLVQYRVGHYIEHVRYGYFGFIVGWDETCKQSMDWIIRMGVENLPRGSAQPFYNVIAEDGSSRYVAEENIHVLEDSRPVDRSRLWSMAGRYFKRWSEADNKFIHNLEEEYPQD